MKQLIPKLVLTLTAVPLLIVGLSVLFIPEAFAAANGVALPADPGLLSEYRAPGGLLVVCALFSLLAVFRGHHTKAALAFSAVVYSCYGLSRLIGVALDGLPSDALIQATVFEMVFGLVCFATWLALGHHATGRRHTFIDERGEA